MKSTPAALLTDDAQKTLCQTSMRPQRHTAHWLSPSVVPDRSCQQYQLATVTTRFLSIMAPRLFHHSCSIRCDCHRCLAFTYRQQHKQKHPRNNSSNSSSTICHSATLCQACNCCTDATKAVMAFSKSVLPSCTAAAASMQTQQQEGRAQCQRCKGQQLVRAL